MIFKSFVPTSPPAVRRQYSRCYSDLGWWAEAPVTQVLGRGLRGLPRGEIIVASKVGRYGQDKFDFSAARVKASVRESLQRLQLDYLDLVQTHDIEFTNLDQVTCQLSTTNLNAIANKYVDRRHILVSRQAPFGSRDVSLLG